MTRSPFIRSAADATLTFWHQRKEEDYERRPGWREQHSQAHRDTCDAELFARLIREGRFVDELEPPLAPG